MSRSSGFVLSSSVGTVSSGVTTRLRACEDAPKIEAGNMMACATAVCEEGSFVVITPAGLFVCNRWHHRRKNTDPNRGKEKVGSRNTPASHVVECRMAAEPGRLRPWLRVASKEGLRTTADAGRVVALVPPSRGGCAGREA